MPSKASNGILNDLLDGIGTRDYHDKLIGCVAGRKVAPQAVCPRSGTKNIMSICAINVDLSD